MPSRSARNGERHIVPQLSGSCPMGDPGWDNLRRLAEILRRRPDTAKGRGRRRNPAARPCTATHSPPSADRLRRFARSGMCRQAHGRYNSPHVARSGFLRRRPHGKEARPLQEPRSPAVHRHALPAHGGPAAAIRPIRTARAGTPSPQLSLSCRPGILRRRPDTGNGAPASCCRHTSPAERGPAAAIRPIRACARRHTAATTLPKLPTRDLEAATAGGKGAGSVRSTHEPMWLATSPRSAGQSPGRRRWRRTRAPRLERCRERRRSEAAVGEAGQLAADLLQPAEVEVRRHHRHLVRGLRHHRAPRVDDHAAPETRTRQARGRRSGPPPPRSTGSRSPARAAAPPSGRARCAS